MAQSNLRPLTQSQPSPPAAAGPGTELRPSRAWRTCSFFKAEEPLFPVKPQRERKAKLLEAGENLSAVSPLLPTGLVGPGNRGSRQLWSHLTLTPPQVGAVPNNPAGEGPRGLAGNLKKRLGITVLTLQ